MNAKEKEFHRIQTITRALPEIPLPPKEYMGKNWPADKAALLVQIVKQAGVYILEEKNYDKNVKGEINKKHKIAIKTSNCMSKKY